MRGSAFIRENTVRGRPSDLGAGGKTGNDFSPEKGLGIFFSIFSPTPARSLMVIP